MAQRIYFKDSTGSTIIPVADGSFLTDALKASQDEAEVYFSFYSDADATQPVNPTAGTLTVYGEYESGFFLEATGGTVQANTVASPIATFTPPVMDGLSIRARVDLSGVTGAAYMRALVFKR